MPDKKLRRRLENLFADRTVTTQTRTPPAPAPPVDREAPRQVEDPLQGRAAGPSLAGAPDLPPDQPTTPPRLLGWTWETDGSGRYTFCSPEVTAVLGYSVEEMLGQTLTNFLVDREVLRDLQGTEDAGAEQPPEGDLRQVMEAFSQGRPLDDLRLLIRRKDGQSVPLVTQARPLFDDAGRLSGYQGVTHRALPASLATEGSAEGLREAEIEVPAPLAASDTLRASAAAGLRSQIPVRGLTAAEWRAFLDKQGGQAWGYLDTARGLSSVGDFTTPEMKTAVNNGEMVFYDNQSASPALGRGDRHAGRAIAIPIQLQNQTIGALDFFDESGGVWSEDDLALVRAVTDQLALALENARLFDATRDQLTKRTLLYEVTRAAASAVNLTEALQSAAEALARVLPDVNIAILLLEADNRTLRIRASVGFSPDMVNTLAARVGTGVVGRVAQTNQPALIPDTRSGQQPDYLAWKSNTLSALTVPLALGDRVIGVLNVESPRVNAFDESDLQLLSTLAGTLAAIIVNNNLLDQINRERERLALLNDVLEALTRTLDLDVQLDAVLSFAPRLGAQHGYILLLGEIEAETIFRSTIPGLEHFTPAEATEFGNTIARRGLEKWVIENRQAALVPDTRQDHRWLAHGELLRESNRRAPTDPSHAAEEPARSVISVPLRTSRGALSGVLAFTHPAPGTFTQDHLALVESISAQVAVAVENARLYAQTHAQRRNAETLARATQAMNRSALNENELLQALLDELFEAYHPDSVIIFQWELASHMLTPRHARFDPSLVEDPLQGVVTAGGGDSPEGMLRDAPAVEDPLQGSAPQMQTAFRPVRAADRPALWTIIQTAQGAITPLREQNGQITESMALPLIYGGEVEGVVEVVHTSPVGRHGLDQDNLNLFQGIMTTLASALQTARLYAVQRETAERLAEVDRLKSQFLANMSHELRTPLNSIIGFSRVILKGIDGPVTDLQTQDLTSIYSSGQHLLGLINDILDLARIEAGKMELVLDELDLRDVIKGVLSTAVGLVKDKPITLHEEVALDLPPVHADSMRVRQVMLNLLSNAAKFTDEGRITLRARPVQTLSPVSGQTESFLEIGVIDTGHGIAPEDMAKLFEPFSQVDASPTRKVGGSGLGLNICRQLIELHGGRIWVESDGVPGKGSTFSFILPVNRPALQVEDPLQGDDRSREADDADAARGAEVILSIDDDQGVLNLYRRYLEPRGYKVVGVTRSAEAVAQAAAVQPAAILLDVLMPGKDGWQVLAELKQNEQTRSLPVIMCTIASDPGRAFDMGAADYLTKPILESDLLRALSKIPVRGKNLRAQPEATRPAFSRDYEAT